MVTSIVDISTMIGLRLRQFVAVQGTRSYHQFREIFISSAGQLQSWPIRNKRPEFNPRTSGGRWSSTNQNELENYMISEDLASSHSHSDAMSNSNFRIVPKSRRQLDLSLLKRPDQPENARVLKVSVIGAPNAGKSTLTNRLLGWRVSSTSSKVHTTRSKISAVLTEEEKQIIFLDTPGLTTPSKTKRHHLERSLLTDPHSSFNDADLVCVVVDVSKPWGRNELDKEVLKALLMHPNRTSILILNKIDELKSMDTLLSTTRNLTNGVVDGQKDSQMTSAKMDNPTSPQNMLNKITRKEFQSSSSESDIEELVDPMDKQAFHDYYMQWKRLSRVVENQKGYSQFERVFMVSAKEGDGVLELRRYFLEKALPGDWLYHSSMMTDQDPLSIAQQCVWEKLMDHLPNEVPYNVDVEIVKFQEDEYGVLRIAIDLHCYTKRQLGLILGPRGQRVKLISEQAKQELMNTFRCELTLMISVHLREKKKRGRR